MTIQIGFCLAILAAAVGLFVADRWPTDVVSLLMMVTLVLSGLLTPEEAFGAFASPVVVAVSGLLVVSAALFHTGVASRLGRGIVRLAGSSEPRLVAGLMIAASLLSGVMNNVAATAVLIPVVHDISLKTDRAPSRLLIPVATATVVGGTLTIIGSPPNLIASEALAQAGLPALGLLDTSLIGVLITSVAIVFMVTIGRRLLPERSLKQSLVAARLPSQLIDLYRVPERIFALHIPPESPLTGQTLIESRLGSEYQLTVLGVINESGSQMAPPPTYRIHAGDRLLVQGGPRRVQQVASDKGVRSQAARVDDTDLLTDEVGVAEVVLPPRSAFAGRKLRELRFRQRCGLTVLALWRRGQAVERHLSEEPLRVGDAFLVQGPWSRIHLLHGEPGLLFVSQDQAIPRRTRQAPLAVAILLSMVGAVMLGLLPLPVAALAAGVLCVLTGCLQAEEARGAIEWRAVFLIAGMLALAAAMQKTGAAEWIALTVLSPAARLGPVALVAVLLLMTAGLTVGISNYATAALLAPVALTAAVSHNLDPTASLLAVAAGTAVALFTPLAHPGFVLVMGPGGYGFRDFVRVGLRLGVLIYVTALIQLAVL